MRNRFILKIRRYLDENIMRGSHQIPILFITIFSVILIGGILLYNDHYLNTIKDKNRAIEKSSLDLDYKVKRYIIYRNITTIINNNKILAYDIEKSLNNYYLENPRLNSTDIIKHSVTLKTVLNNKISNYKSDLDNSFNSISLILNKITETNQELVYEYTLKNFLENSHINNIFKKYDNNQENVLILILENLYSNERFMIEFSENNIEKIPAMILDKLEEYKLYIILPVYLDITTVSFKEKITYKLIILTKNNLINTAKLPLIDNYILLIKEHNKSLLNAINKINYIWVFAVVIGWIVITIIISVYINYYLISTDFIVVSNWMKKNR